MVQGKIPATLPGTRSTPFVVGQAPMPVAPESLKVSESRACTVVSRLLEMRFSSQKLHYCCSLVLWRTMEMEAEGSGDGRKNFEVNLGIQV